MDFSRLLWPPANLSKIVEEDGTKTHYFFTWLDGLYNLLKGTIGRGYTGTVTLTKLTGGGSNGTLTYVNGVVVSVVPPT